MSNNEKNPDQNITETEHNKDRLKNSKFLNSAIAYIQENYVQENKDRKNQNED